MNANGVMDDGEPSTTTDKQGAYQLNLPVSQYDQNSDGVVDSKDGQLVAIGGIDTATGLKLGKSTHRSTNSDGFESIDHLGKCTPCKSRGS